MSLTMISQPRIWNSSFIVSAGLAETECPELQLPCILPDEEKAVEELEDMGIHFKPKALKKWRNC